MFASKAKPVARPIPEIRHAGPAVISGATFAIDLSCRRFSAKTEIVASISAQSMSVCVSRGSPCVPRKSSAAKPLIGFHLQKNRRWLWSHRLEERNCARDARDPGKLYYPTKVNLSAESW